MTGGDFVRTTKQLVDLLRQIASVATGSRAGTVAGRTAESLVRGIVAASSTVGSVPDDDLPELEIELEIDAEVEPELGSGPQAGA